MTQEPHMTKAREIREAITELCALHRKMLNAVKAGPVDLEQLAYPDHWPRCDCMQSAPRVDALAGSIYCPGCCEGPEAIDGRIDWVICGGESGPGARPMHPGWARSLRQQCFEAEVPFHFKQWGAWVPLQSNGDGYWPTDTGGCIRLSEDGARREEGWPMQLVGKKAAGRLLDGVEHNGMPERVGA